LDTSIEGGKAFEQILSQFINDNWRDILTEMKPVISKAIAKIYKDAINDVYNMKPHNNFFVE
jgi:hypothetical protein